MTIWNNCKMTTLYYSDESASENYPCIVKIDENEILVEYDNGVIQYRGYNGGNGHFELNAPVVDGKATLHMHCGDAILEGSWIEESYRGMWRIELA